ncbi:CARDB domain-containing protein [Niabella hibiscisoli]|uniref:CARDB domain-containing protein n=1 Tax=Niabella hibiscisoli TaxID=1825928 RepID=UPI001F0E1FCD|nr:CARDB domain-containing protein [Niabella hibiscisoli]MCH5715072.1 hypothetical protein [Niabella hibiscisoli]
MYQFSKPDYAIEDAMVTVTPGIISVAESNFSIKAKILNLGKAVNRDLIVELKRTYADMSTKIVRRDTLPGIRYADSINYQIEIDPAMDKGANKFTITIDPENNIEELFENNNTLTKDIFIYEDDIKPIYPYDLSIVNKQGIVFAASTGNPFAGSRSYIMEMDTSKLFSSSAKVSQTKNSTGGVVEFSPSITFRDSVVYYWRVAAVPSSGQEQVWSGASFTYIPGANSGYSQSHYAQFNNDDLNEYIKIKESGLWVYDSLKSTITISNAIFPTITPTSVRDYALQIDDVYHQYFFLDRQTLSQIPNKILYVFI